MAKVLLMVKVDECESSKLTYSGADSVTFLLGEDNSTKVLRIIRIERTTYARWGTNMVDSLGVTLKVCRILCDHFYRSTKGTPRHSMHTVGVASGDDIISGPVNGAVDQETCGICWSSHVPWS